MKVFTEYPELRLCPGMGSQPPGHFLYWNERGFTEDAVLRDEVPIARDRPGRHQHAVLLSGQIVEMPDDISGVRRTVQ